MNIETSVAADLVLRVRSDEAGRRARAGLPAGLTVMTGHQAEAWHAGIAAKFFLARAIAEQFAGACVWLTPDHAASQPWRVVAPALHRGRLLRTALDLAPPLPPGRPTCAAAPELTFRADWGPAEPPIESVARGVHRHTEALARAAGASNAARQAIEAMEDHLGTPARPDAKIWASELANAGALDELLTAMRADPAACVRAHNDAASAHPEAAVGSLRTDGRLELPLWHRTDATLRRVHADELADLPRDRLAPRALLMTAAARLHLCDVFIHGTGGAAYDRVMKAWITSWLGNTVAARLAPVVTATATLRLPLDHLAKHDRDIDRAAWLAHAAGHNPALLGDDAAAQEKERLLGEITNAKAAGTDPARAYREMHELLERTRRDHATAIGDLKTNAAEAAMLRGSEEVAQDRTWPVFLHDLSMVGELADQMRTRAAVLTSSAQSPRA